MNIKFEIKGKTDVKNLYVRMYQGKFDVSAPIGLLVLESDWDAENNSFYLANPLNLKLQELKVAILRAYNQSFSQGEIITSIWLKQVVKEEFNRPINEIALVNDSKDIYLTDFGDWWNNNKADLWKVGPKKLLSSVQKSQYKKIISQLKDFEKSVGFKLVLKDMTLDNLYEVVNYFEENDYNSSTISRNIDRIRFFMNRASEEGLKVSNVRSQRVYIDKDSEEIEQVYLNENEIQKIFDLNLEHDYELDNIRNNFVLALWSGLRITDFMTNLKTDNIKDGIISIKTQKTGSFVKIPIHPMAKSILNKNFGNLPRKVDVSEYNKQIKTICQLAEIDNQVYGKLWNPIKKRRELVYAPKFKFVSSHIARKSLTTNLSGKVSNEVIQKTMGWNDDTMRKHYDKTSKNEYVETLKNYWYGK